MAYTTENNQSGLMAKAVKEGVLAGLIAFGMFLLFVGIETYQDINNQLVWRTRWGLLAVFVAIAAIGRFLTVGFIKPHLDARKLAKAKSGVLEISDKKSFFHKHFLKIALVFLLCYPFLAMMIFGRQGSLKYVDNFGIQILIYVMLAWGLNIVVGLAGLLDLGYVAFYAVGAYSYALLSANFGFSFWLLLPMAGILAGFWGIILGFPVLRLRGDYLAIVTLAFGEIIRLVLINWTDVTRGTFGISGIAKASFFGIWSFDVGAANNFNKAWGLPSSSVYYKMFLFYVILALCLITAYVTIRLRRMPIGRAWEALREDEIACRSPESSRRSGASFLAFRSCGCVATISPSSPSPSAKSFALC
jgi:branched-chain amino acid transport system permease protein